MKEIVTTHEMFEHRDIHPQPPDDRAWRLVDTAAVSRQFHYNENDEHGAYIETDTVVFYTWELVGIDLRGYPGPIGPKR